MLPAAFGPAVYQINIFISTLLASFLPEGSVSFLYYADRIVELPLGIFGIAIGTAALPSFSEQVARGHYEEMKKTISFSLRLMLFITIPAMIGIIALQEPSSRCSSSGVSSTRARRCSRRRRFSGTPWPLGPSPPSGWS